jgi:hypothetical protein
MAHAEKAPRTEVGNRRVMRHTVEVVGRYRSRVGVSRDIWIKDISEDGCSFFDKFSLLEVDSTILFRVGPIGPISADVRWREKSTVGVKFGQPLHPSVLAHIIRTMDKMDKRRRRRG